MSRIGKRPIPLPDKVKLTIDGRRVRAEGPGGKVETLLAAGLDVKVEGKTVQVLRPDDSRHARSMHGLARTQLVNLVQGADKGFVRELEINGVGYRAEVKGREVHFALGYSHPVVYRLPEGVTAEVKGNRVALKSADKYRVGLSAAEVRALRPPEPYKGKGIKYAEEQIRRKEGKAGATGSK